jgi:hypothetical protein
MKTSMLLWVAALLLTLASAYYQRLTGPTWPVDGKDRIADADVTWSLARSHGGAGDQAVKVYTSDRLADASLFYKRYKTDDDWTRLHMQRDGDTLFAYLPHQPPAGKLEYAVEIEIGDAMLRVPEKESIVTRFKGHVPAGYLIPHVIAMFFAMFISMRVGLEVFRKNPKLKTMTVLTTLLLIIGGLIFGPIVQKFAFGEYWTGFPYGTDLTDNKTLFAFIAWMIAIAAVWKTNAPPSRRWFVLGASVVTLLVYLIPHSMMGSELDYRELDRLQMQYMESDTSGFRAEE